MSRRNIADLPLPPKRYRVDLTTSGMMAFETVQDARREDLRRARGLERAIASGSNLIDKGEAKFLAAALRGTGATQCEPTSIASSIAMRNYRIRVPGGILKLARRGRRCTTCTVIPKTWEFTPEELNSVDPRKLIKGFLSDLYRCGAKNVRGWLFACIHGEFDPVARVYRLHLHIVCRKDFVPVLDRLRKLPKYKSSRTLPDGSPSPVYRRVWIRRKPLFNLPDPITYVVQSFWPSRPIFINDKGQRKRTRLKQAIPEPYQSQVLQWHDQWELKDIMLMVHLRMTKRGLRMSRPR